MKKTKLNHALVIKVVLVSVLCFCGIGLLAGQEFAGGQGTEADPWQIATAEHLDNVRNYLGEEHSDKHFVQTANIDLTDYLWDDDEDDYINEGHGWQPIGTEGNSFCGQYDGDGHTIDGLYINRPDEDYQGLFGKTHAGAVSNLGLTNVDVTGNHTVGALTALSYNHSRIRDCYGEGRVLGKGDRVGGLVGENYSSLIAASHFRGTVKGEMSTGGLAGRNYDSTIENSYAAADVNGGSRWVAGLVGKSNYSLIDGSFSSGSVKGEELMIGGLVGKNYSSAVSNSYSIANVQGPKLVGGLVGLNFGYIENCYSTGYVRGDLSFGVLSGPFGTEDPVTKSYWNLETSGQLESFGGRGLTTSAMTREESFEGWDFDDTWSLGQDFHYPYHAWQETAASHNYPGPQSLTCSPDNENFEIELNWQMSVGTPLRYNIYRNDNLMDTVDHPITDYLDENVLEDEVITYCVTAVISTPEHGEFETVPSNWVTIGPFGKFAGGGGYINNPWQINTAEHLHNVRHFLGKEHRNKHFIQTADIDLTGFLWDEEEEDYINQGRGWLPIGGQSVDMPFFAAYNGNGHIIEDLYVNRPEEDYLGLFGVTLEAIIRDLGLLDIHIEGNNHVGGLIADDRSTDIRSSIIENCWVTGVISAAERVGGLIGQSSITKIRNCYSKVNVSGVKNVGGLVGFGAYEITNCYSVGTVEGEDHTGGLIGRFSHNVTNSYWDIEKSGQETSDGGEGRTTEQMTYPYSENTYVGWDFDEIWNVDEDHSVNSGYPYLREVPTVSVEDDIVAEIPSSPMLTNYPNPFNPKTTIEFTVNKETEATLSVYNIKKQFIKTLHSGFIKAGKHSFIWNGRDDSGREVSSGVYFYRLTTGDYDKVNKMLLVK